MITLEGLPKEVHAYLFSYVISDNRNHHGCSSSLGCRYHFVSKTFRKGLLRAAGKCSIKGCRKPGIHRCWSGVFSCCAHSYTFGRIHYKLTCKQCNKDVCLCDATTIGWEKDITSLVKSHNIICRDCGGTSPPPLNSEFDIEGYISKIRLRNDVWSIKYGCNEYTYFWPMLTIFYKGYPFFTFNFASSKIGGESDENELHGKRARDIIPVFYKLIQHFYINAPNNVIRSYHNKSVLSGLAYCLSIKYQDECRDKIEKMKNARKRIKQY